MRAKLRIELRDRSGECLACRQARNSVMQGGAALVAHLFSGGGGPITHMGVGISDESETDAFDTTELTNPADGPDALQGETIAEIPPDAFTVEEPDPLRRVVTVKVRGTMPREAAIGTIREAALIARTEGGDVLYNRVTFAPIDKGDDHELTLFWEVSFPYGDLVWLE